MSGVFAERIPDPLGTLPLKQKRILKTPLLLAHFTITVSCGFILRFWLIAFDLEFIFSSEDRVQLMSEQEGKCRGGIHKSRGKCA